MIPADTRVQGFRYSSEMLKNYRNLNVWEKSYELCLDIQNKSKISGDTLKKDKVQIEKMGKHFIKSLENKTLMVS